MHKILVVEDNIEINEIISNKLSDNGYQVFSVFDAFKALTVFNENKIDLIITDLMLPIKSGEDLIKDIRSISNVYILIVSAKVNLEDRLTGLTLGADDYIIKPFSGEELLLKINNHFKRVKNEELYSFNKGELVFTIGSNKVELRKKKIELTSIEYLILEALVINNNKILSREQLLQKSYKHDNDVYDRVIDVHIKNIRSKFKNVYKNSKFIKTIYGLGYSFEGDYDE